MKILIALCICLSGSLAVVAQTAAHMRVEGRVSVFFGWEGAQLRDSYVLCEGAVMPVKLSPSGYFTLHHLDTGEVKLRLSLWGGTYTHDTTLRLHDALLNFHWEIRFDSEVNAIRAQYDQRYARPRLLIVGGIAPAEVVRQETFEQQYGIQYHSYGCISPSSAGMRAYNQWVFQYLDATYGRQWRKTVRADVLGLEKKWYQGRR
jgi:hypothetical protein